MSLACFETTVKVSRPNMSCVEEGISIVTGGGFAFNVFKKGFVYL